MTRAVTSHKLPDGCVQDELEVLALDDSDPNDACNDYVITHHHYQRKLCTLAFQDGAVSEVGVTGITNEAVLAVVLDRIERFQTGGLSCEENHMAIYHLRKALDYLKKRTTDRLARGVEGTDKP